MLCLIHQRSVLLHFIFLPIASNSARASWGDSFKSLRILSMCLYQRLSFAFKCGNYIVRKIISITSQAQFYLELDAVYDFIWYLLETHEIRLWTGKKSVLRDESD